MSTIQLKLIVPILLLFIGTASAQTTNVDFARLQDFLDSSREKLAIPNLELVVVSENEVVYRYSTDSSATYEKPFYIGSVSKSLTALGVLKLVQDGRLSLDSRVTSILPVLGFTAFGEDITVRSLLNHTSGIRKTQGFEALPSLDVLESAGHTIAIHAQPGSRHEYSNLNYSLLGLIIEKESGFAFSEYIAKFVFKPLQMSNASAGSRDEMASKVVPQYQYVGPFPVHSSQVNFDRSSFPAGFICSSSNDLANYLQMHLSDGEFRGKQMLDSALIKTMRTPWNGTSHGYAMGWKQGSYNDRLYYQHLGSTATSYNGIFLIPEQRLGFVVLTNTNSLQYAEQIMEGSLSILTNGDTPAVSAGEYWFRFGTLLVLIGVVGSSGIRFVKLCFGGSKEVVKRKGLIGVAALVTGLAAVWLLFPTVFSIPLVAFVKLQPDIGITLLSLFVLPLMLSIARLTSRNLKSNSLFVGDGMAESGSRPHC